MNAGNQFNHGFTRKGPDQNMHRRESVFIRLFPRSLCLVVLAVSAVGCNSTPPAAKPKATAEPEYHFPPRPTIAPPAVKVFHQDEDTYTLVTKPDATDDEISAILWEFRDAAHNKTFDKLHLSEKFIDARKPTVWIHIYRGPKCANEKFVKGKYPCGAKYNGAGDYTLGSPTDPLWDDGVLHNADGSETKLWNPDAPYTSSQS
jgi:hypothetical protein